MQSVSRHIRESFHPLAPYQSVRAYDSSRSLKYPHCLAIFQSFTASVRHSSQDTFDSSQLCNNTIVTMDCFQDFCLFCDKDSPDGAYCSQQCKLADLERSSNSNPSSPSSPTARQSWNSSSHRHQAYHYRQSSTPGYDAPTTGHSSRPRSSYFMWNPSQQQSTTMDERQLTPSSSRTSLSSTTSGSGMTSAGGISNSQAKQLAEYFSSFDAAKAAKRRSSLR